MEGSLDAGPFRLFDRSGHSPQMEESEAFDGVLLEWLEAKGLAA